MDNTRPTEVQFNADALVRGINAATPAEADLRTFGVLVVGEYADKPGTLLLVLAMEKLDTGLTVAVPRAMSKELLRDLEALGAASADGNTTVQPEA